jgi:hypothetical protein
VLLDWEVLLAIEEDEYINPDMTIDLQQSAEDWLTINLHYWLRFEMGFFAE